MQTPWGTSQSVRVITRGVADTTTAGHGGIGITELAANTLPLSQAARDVSLKQYGRYWFEEDCLWAVAAWELGPAHWPVLLGRNGYEPNENGGSIRIYAGRNPDRTERHARVDIRDHLRRTISQWCPEYLQAIGETLDPEGYAIACLNQESERMRREKSPDYIVSAMSLGDGRVKVATAADTWHIITSESYADRNGRLNLLSACTVLESNTAPGFY